MTTSKFSRRTILKGGIGTVIALPVATHLFGEEVSAATAEATGHGPIASHLLALDASQSASAIPTLPLQMGESRRPDGQSLTSDSRSLIRNGHPWLPAMGEFHYSRYPFAKWSEELRKMKSGGIDIVSTYVFWIHHEEIEGHWDWEGQRSLREFARQCAAAGMDLIVRLGPWAHGEVRNGGHPDWIMKKGLKLRSEDPGYLAEVRRLYDQIAEQIKGQLWKDGGPIIAVQVDNEYRGPASYLLKLKRISTEAGIDVPLYTRTGWPNLTSSMPVGELLPFFGEYPDGFWDRSLKNMPGSYPDGYRFRTVRSDSAAAMGAQFTQDSGHGDDSGPYPYLCCELGGGMAASYHRRIAIEPRDIAALALVKLGSGNNLQGYYMYHGGTNPDGKLTTLQETQESGGYNDLPIKTYDFSAPLGEFGQVRDHYRYLRRLHVFLRDWGAPMATMAAHLPTVVPTDSRDDSTLRWSARTDGRAGFVFVNNYQRLEPLPAKTNNQFHINLVDGPLVFPASPVTVPESASFFWPFGMDLGPITLEYATAQPICRLRGGGTETVVFAATDGIPPEFMFAEAAGLSVDCTEGATTRIGNKIHVKSIVPGGKPAIRVRNTKGDQVLQIIVLDDHDSLHCWKTNVNGRDHILLSPAEVDIFEKTLSLTSENAADLVLSALPPLRLAPSLSQKFGENEDGAFRKYSFSCPMIQPTPVHVQPVAEAARAPEVRMGSAGVAQAPTEDAWEHAASWRIHLITRIGDAGDIAVTEGHRLEIDYAGDAARLYRNGVLVADNFFNGNPFCIGLDRTGESKDVGELLLKILPLRADAPIYLSDEARLTCNTQETCLVLKSVKIIERHRVELTLAS